MFTLDWRSAVTVLAGHLGDADLDEADLGDAGEEPLSARSASLTKAARLT